MCSEWTSGDFQRRASRTRHSRAAIAQGRLQRVPTPVPESNPAPAHRQVTVRDARTARRKPRFAGDASPGCGSVPECESPDLRAPSADSVAADVGWGSERPISVVPGSGRVLLWGGCVAQGPNGSIGRPETLGRIAVWRRSAHGREA